MLFQTKAYTTKTCDANHLYGEIRFLERISAKVLSNGPIYGKRRYFIDGTETIRWFIEISSSSENLSLLFLAEGTSLDEYMIRKIAASFSR